MAVFLSPADPLRLPDVGSPERWAALQTLRRAPRIDPEPWLEAVEAGRLTPATDLLSVLAERLDGAATARLLAWWLAQPTADPALLALIGRRRDPRCRELLGQALAPLLAGACLDPAAAARARLLLPLLGHQRHPPDGALLLELALAPLPLQQRRAALEGLALGLAAWPLPPLRLGLRSLVEDLDPGLAAMALDLLARLPGARRQLAAIEPGLLAPPLARRLERRLASLARLDPSAPAGRS